MALKLILVHDDETERLAVRRRALGPRPLTAAAAEAARRDAEARYKLLRRAKGLR